MADEEGYDAGEAFLQIVPSFRGVLDSITAEAAKWGQTAGKRFSDTFNDEVKRNTKAPVGPGDEQTRQQGTKTGRTFADSFKAQVTAALRSLPEAKIGAETTEANQKIKDLRAQLLELSDKRVGVDLGADEALAEIDRIKAELDDLAAKSPDVDVQINTSRASAELTRLRAEIDRLKAEDPEVDVKADTAEAETKLAALRANSEFAVGVDTDGAIFKLLGLDTLLKKLPKYLTIGIAVEPLIGGALALLGPAAAIGLGGAAVAASTLPALGAVKNALDAQKSAQQGSGQAASQAAQQAIAAAEQVKSAELSLAETRRRIANDEIQSAEQIKNAEQSVTDAQNALNAAREQAARDLEDAENKAKDSVLSLQQAQLDLNQATAIYQNSLLNPGVPAATLAQEKLDVAKAQQSLTEAQETATNAQVDATKAQKDGVANAPSVVSAQEALTRAQQQLADARRQQTLQAADDATSLEQAEMSLASAQRAQAQAAAGSSAATNNLASDLAKMTPLERQLYDTISASKKTFDEWGKSLEPVTLPLLTDGLALLTKLLPVIEPLVRVVGTAIDSVLKQFTTVEQSAGFKSFVATLSQLAGPAIHSIADFLINIGSAVASLVKAFAPLSGVVENGLVALSGGLARAAQSPALASFVKTLVNVAPTLLSAFQSVGGLISSVLKQVAPLAQPVLSVIGQLGRSLTLLVTGIGPTMKTLFDTLAPVLDAVIKSLGPVLVPLINGLATAITPLLPLIGQLVTDFLAPLGHYFTVVFDALQPVIDQFVHALQPVLPQIAAAFDQLVTALEPVWPVFGQILEALIPLIKPLSDLIVAVLRLVSTNELPLWIDLLKILPPALGIVVDVLNFLIRVITDLINWVSDTVSWFTRFKETAETVGHAISNAWDGVWTGLRTGWTDVRDFLSGEWKKFVKTASDLWGDITSGVSNAWSAVVTSVKDVWSDVEDVFSSAVNFVTQDIVNPLIRTLNDVLGVFNVKIKTIPPISIGSDPATTSSSNNGVPTGPHARNYALGGVLPGYSPGVDNISLPSMLFSGGEGILVPEATRALGGAQGIQAINSMFSNRVSSPGHFAGGGTIRQTPADVQAILKYLSTRSSGGILGGIGDVLGDVVDAIRGGLADVAVGGLTVAEAPIKAALGLAPSGFAKTLGSGVFDSINKAAGDFIRGHTKKVSDQVASTLGNPTGDHKLYIQTALGLSGVKDTVLNEAAVNAIVDHESGWNQLAINLTDSNALAGHPSMGLMQTILSTFEAHRIKSLPDDVFDPLANLVAGIRYAIGRYSSLQDVPGVKALANGGKYVGYDEGGWLEPGFTLAYNGSGRAEPIAPRETFDQLMAGQGAASLDGARLVLDAGSLGQLTGFIDMRSAGTAAAKTRDSRARIGRIS